jgi:NADH-quinone oxidoreductase subunit N
MTGGVFLSWAGLGAFRDVGLLLAAVIVLFAIELVRPRPAGGRPVRPGTGPAPSYAGWILLAGALVALAVAALWPVPDTVLWGGAFVVDPLSRFYGLFFLMALALVTAASLDFLGDRAWRGEFYFLLGSATAGMMLLAGAGDLLVLYVALELSSISLYVMASLEKGESASQEAGIKYLLTGAFSSAVLLFGMALVYAATGSAVLVDIYRVSVFQQGNPLLVLGMIFILAGLGFKVAVVPFHMWAPDVYQGGPAPMVAFASVASKAAGFAALTRVLAFALASSSGAWAPVLACVTAATLVVGSFAAIPQTNVRRLLGYSSIAQAGYILLGFTAGGERGAAAVLYYLVVYLFTNLGAFLSVMIFSRHAKSDEISAYAGLARRSPLLALAFMLSLLSLAGIPPLGGFTGKMFLFASAMARSGQYLWLVILGAVLSIVSLYYYLEVIRRMYITEPSAGGRIPVHPAAAAALLLCIAGIIATGVWPSVVLDAATVVARTVMNP